MIKLRSWATALEFYYILFPYREGELIFYVNDVLERTISISARGTLPTFIEEPEIGEAEFASIYISEPRFIDERDNIQTHGRREDTYSYLVEQEGTFKLPEVEVSWWSGYFVACQLATAAFDCSDTTLDKRKKT